MYAGAGAGTRESSCREMNVTTCVSSSEQDKEGTSPGDGKEEGGKNLHDVIDLVRNRYPLGNACDKHSIQRDHDSTLLGAFEEFRHASSGELPKLCLSGITHHVQQANQTHANVLQQHMRTYHMHYPCAFLPKESATFNEYAGGGSR